MRFAVVCLVAIAASVVALAQDGAATPPLQVPRTALDKGLPDAAWFGAESSLEFRYAGQIDHAFPYFRQAVMWVRPGFELRGKRVRFAAWGVPQLPAKRSAHDAKAATKFVAEFFPLLGKTLATKLNPPVVPVETDAEAEVLVLGRVVDCTAEIFYFVHPSVTIDVKVLDARTGELLAAIHNEREGFRLASQHATILLNLSEKGFQAVYANARPVCER